MQYLVEPLGRFLTWTFEFFLESLENLPNNLFIILGFVMLFYWLMLQNKYNKEASNDESQIK